MKQTKTVLSVLLCLVAALFCSAPAFAQTPAQETRIMAEAEPPERFMNVATPENITPTVDWEPFFRALWSFFTEGADAQSLNVRAYHIPYTEANFKYIYAYCDTNPIFLGARPTGIEYSNGSNAEIIAIYNNGTHRTELAVIKAKYNACMDVIDQLTFGIRNNSRLSDYEKCLLLHDRLAAWAEYDLVRAQNNTVPAESFNAYGPLVNHIGVCDGYARAYGWLLDTVGIENYFTSSSQMSHAWNKVVLDGNVYFVDVTHDDPTFETNGRVLHKNFMISSAKYKTTSANHDKTDVDMSAVSTNYENTFDKHARTEIVYLNGKFWYIDENTNKLMSCGSMGADAAAVKELPQKQYTSNYSYYPYFPKMTAIGNEILYLCGREIRAYDVVTGADKIAFTPNSDIFADTYSYLLGLQQIDGVVCVTASSTPNFDATTKPEHSDYYVYCPHTNMAVLESARGADGELREICTACRALFKTSGSGVCSHSYTAQTVKETALRSGATCTAAATYYFSCANCGAVERNDSHVFSYGNALGHDYSVTARQEATCTVEGSITYTCSRSAAHSYSEKIPLKPHADNNADGKCDSCGKVLNNVDTGDSKPKGDCKYCGETHTGPFGWLIKFFHSILALFGARK